MNTEAPVYQKKIDLYNRYRNLKLHPMDIIAIGYLAITGCLIILFRANLQGWYVNIGYRVIAFIIITELIKASSISQNRGIEILRTFYPLFSYGLAWLELDSLFTLIFPFYGTNIIINIDKAIFGIHPTLWIERLFTPWLTELMNFFYAVYFLFLPTGTIIVYLRRGKQKTLDLLFLVFLSYLTAYLFAIIFPVEGAWTALEEIHTAEPIGGIFLKLNHFIQNHGSVKGGAMPSIHVTGAFAAAWAIRRYEKRLGLIIMILSVGVALSTVYCRYHHALDAIAGVIWATSFYLIGERILRMNRFSRGDTI